MRHATVPMVAFELWIDAGASADPADKAGLASATAEMLRKGAGDRDAAAFAEALDFLGANFSTSVNRDRTRIHLDLLTKDVDEGLALLADAVLRPTLSDEEIAKQVGRMAEGVTESKDNPRFVLGDYFQAALFGDHPYGNPVDGTETGLAAVGPADVRAFHADHYGANRALLAVAGDLDLDEMAARIEAAFGEWGAAGAEAPALVEPEPAGATRVVLVNKSDTPQTWFQIGNLGPAWTAEDYAATELVRTIFSGRFTSWLNNALRIESGLTYGASFGISRGKVGGAARLSTFTATETTAEALEMAFAQLARLHEEGIGEEDLASAKAYVKGQAPYDYETAMDLASAMALLQFHGIDRSFLDDFFARIDAVTLDDCAAAVDRWFPRENLTIVAVGVKEEVEGILGEYGPVTVRENSDPGFR
jgi:predicted Zn-dependent peptidase